MHLPTRCAAGGYGDVARVLRGLSRCGRRPNLGRKVGDAGAGRGRPSPDGPHAVVRFAPDDSLTPALAERLAGQVPFHLSGEPHPSGTRITDLALQPARCGRVRVPNP